jgi:hypothetical protein
MSEQDFKVPCPFCDGHGELTRSEITEKLSPAELRKLGDQLAEILKNAERAAVGAGSKGRDFETEVHSWNPQVAMWRRSPKE